MSSANQNLKKIRLEKGISLEEVQKKTKIHMNILKAIEGDTLTNLSPIYLKSFIKIYCNFLGVDPKDFIQEYKEQKKNYVAPEEKSYKKESPQQSQDNKRIFMSVASIKLNSLSLLRKVKKYIVLAVVILVALFILVKIGKFISSLKKKNTQKQAQQAIAIKQDNKKEQKTKKEKATAPQPTTRKNAAQNTSLNKDEESFITLGIRARENCWISLKVDGKVAFQRTLEKGRYESWQARDKMELSLGNAAAVELQVNEQFFNNLGRRGQSIKGIIITRDGLRIP